ncbi:FG-GAP repeat protein [candidate division KSB1 bacterium]|nr:FG-GAP repeat protein [candidate division KSB1 bacterium]
MRNERNLNQKLQFLIIVFMTLTRLGWAQYEGEVKNSNTFYNSSFELAASDLVPTTIFKGVNNGERIGYAVSTAGDVNADGFSDFMVAAYHHYSHGWNCGGVYLFLGADGNRWEGEVNITNADAIFKGKREYEMVGWTVAGGGDFNGDGYDDLLIGAPGNWETAHPNYGLVYIMLGKKNIDWNDDFLLVDNADISYIGEANDDQLGYQVEFLGDLNNDGCDDILISAAFRNEGGLQWSGKVYLVFGKKSGFRREIPIVEETVASFVFPATKATLGFGLDGLGDVNGDGLLDFGITAEGVGKTFLILGHQKIDWGLNYDLKNADVTFIAEKSYQRPGWIVRGVGDVNGDGLADFVITGLNIDDSTGKVYLILGRKNWSNTSYSLTMADASYVGVGRRPECGVSVDGIGDYNGDGLDDFIFGARYYKNNVFAHAGKEFLITGRESGWPKDKKINELNENTFTVNDSIYCIGWASAGVGDFNGDDRPDFIVSAPFTSFDDFHWAGKIYLFTGNYTKFSIAGKVLYNSTSYPIPNANIQIENSKQQIFNIVHQGRYFFEGPPGLSYQVTISKEMNSDIGREAITALDAALVARQILGLEKFNNRQKWQGDVDVDGKLTLEDAVALLKYVVGLPTRTGVKIGEWQFSPTSRKYDVYSQSSTREHFTGYIRGDVDLSWKPEGNLALSKSLAMNYPTEFEVNSKSEIDIPFTSTIEEPIYAFEVECEYDPSAFSFEEINLSFPHASWTKLINKETGRIRAAFYAVEPVNRINNTLFHIKFATLKAFSQKNQISINHLRINNTLLQTENISITGTGKSFVPSTFDLKQNYPNPIQEQTIFCFDLPLEEFVTLKIFNILGQEIVKITAQDYIAGHHEIIWKTLDEAGQKLPAGVYYYQLTAGEFKQIKKMVILP